MTEKQPAALETKNEQSESKPNTAKRYKTEKAELRRRIVSIVLLLVFVPAVIAVGMLEFNDRYYYITASLIIICSFIPFLMIFEKRRPRARELVVIAVMTALGVAGRAAFYMLPQFKPIAATVIITGRFTWVRGRFHYGCINRICIQHVFRARSVDTVADVCTRAAGIHLRAGLPQGYQNKNSACTTVPLRCIINLFHLRRHHGFGICPYGGFGTDVGGIACSICFRAAVQPYFCRCNGGFSFGADAPDTQ